MAIDYLQRDSTWAGFGLTKKHKTGLERLSRDHHSSLLQALVNYDPKKLYSIGKGVNVF
jgi:hypothetical protein